MRVRSDGSSSDILGWSFDDMSGASNLLLEGEIELLEGHDRKERVDESSGAYPDGGECGAAPPSTLDVLRTLAIVAIESRCEYDDAEELTDNFDARRDRAAEINMRVSCSEIGEGPGTGGSGADGGRDGGGLTKEDADSGEGTAKGEPGIGLAGIWVGGAGKEDKRRGTALRLSASRDSV